MSDEVVRAQAEFLHHAHDGHVGRQHGRLGNGGFLEFVLGGFERGFIAIGVDEAGEGTSQDGGHGRVGFRKGLTDQGFILKEVLEHVHVLAALPGEEESHLAGLAAAAVDAMGLEGFGHCRRFGLESAEDALEFFGQFGSVGVVDGQALRAGKLVRAGEEACGQAAGLEAIEISLDPGKQGLGVIGGGEVEALIGFELRLGLAGLAGRRFFYGEGRGDGLRSRHSRSGLGRSGCGRSGVSRGCVWW